MTLNETRLDMALEIYNSCLSRRNYPQHLIEFWKESVLNCTREVEYDWWYGVDRNRFPENATTPPIHKRSYDE